jgi:dTDP-4-amino-4,6-dideoxygalactose transaminase
MLNNCYRLGGVFMDNLKIPFHRTYLTGEELTYIQDCMAQNHFSGNGYYTKKVNTYLETTFHASKALLTTSCSSALDMAAILLDLKVGDEVILPSYTFVSTANAILLRGATPVFADILEDTLNIDPADIQRKITPKTKALFPIHYAGIACEMDAILQLANDYNLRIVEDAAQGVNAKYKNRYLGTIGDVGCYSFHDTKNYSCGEGGAILINRNSQALIERAEIILEKGTDRSKFFRGEVDKYTWIDIGSSFVLSDILAAFLYAQLKQKELIQMKRGKAYYRYYKKLKFLEDEGLLRLPIIPADCSSNFHIFYILLDSVSKRNYLMAQLKSNGISTTFHYVPLHLSPMGQRLGYKPGDLPKTENLSERLLRLPLFAGITEAEQDYVVDNICKWLRLPERNKICI